MSRDLRKYARQTKTRMALGFIALVFIVGEGLIYAIYGRQAALMGMLCLSLAFGILLVIWLLLTLLELFLKVARNG